MPTLSHAPAATFDAATGGEPTTASWRGLIGWLALTVGGGALVGLATNGGSDPWYLALEKPAWTPPSWIFAPVWTALYGLMGVSAWLVWRRGGWRANAHSLRLFLIQLAVNFAWSFMFFALQRPGMALVNIAMLWVLIAIVTWAFARISAPAAWLLLPYFLWVSYATALNASIVWSN